MTSDKPTPPAPTFSEACGEALHELYRTGWFAVAALPWSVCALVAWDLHWIHRFHATRQKLAGDHGSTSLVFAGIIFLQATLPIICFGTRPLDVPPQIGHFLHMGEGWPPRSVSSRTSGAPPFVSVITLGIAVAAGRRPRQLLPSTAAWSGTSGYWLRMFAASRFFPPAAPTAKDRTTINTVYEGWTSSWTKRLRD